MDQVFDLRRFAESLIEALANVCILFVRPVHGGILGAQQFN